MSKSKTRELSNKFWILLVVISLFFIVVIAVGFFLFLNRKKEILFEDKKVGRVTLNYSSSTSSLTISKASPITDKLGMTSDNYFDFSVKSLLEDGRDIEYEISVSKNNNKSTISNDEVRIYLEKEENGIYSKVFGPSSFEGLVSKSRVGSKKNEMVLTNVSRENDGIDNYRLRIWLSDKSTVNSGDYSVDVNLYARVK